MGMTYIVSRRRSLLLPAAAAVTAATLIGSPASAAATPWSILPSANAGTTASNLFHGVSMLDATHGFAVGGADGQATIQSWDGTGWTLMNAPSPDSFDALY